MHACILTNRPQGVNSPKAVNLKGRLRPSRELSADPRTERRASGLPHFGKFWEKASRLHGQFHSVAPFTIAPEANLRCTNGRFSGHRRAESANSSMDTKGSLHSGTAQSSSLSCTRPGVCCAGITARWGREATTLQAVRERFPPAEPPSCHSPPRPRCTNSVTGSRGPTGPDRPLALGGKKPGGAAPAARRRPLTPGPEQAILAFANESQ